MLVRVVDMLVFVVRHVHSVCVWLHSWCEVHVVAHMLVVADTPLALVAVDTVALVVSLGSHVAYPNNNGVVNPKYLRPMGGHSGARRDDAHTGGGAKGWGGV